MNEWKTGACEMQQVRPAADQQQPRSVGLAPPPSLLHDSPVSSMERRGQCDPPFSPPPPFTLLRELYRATRGPPPHPKPFSPPLPPTPATLGRAGVTCACPSRLPLGSPSARSELLRACRGTTPARPTHPPATRAHRLPWPTGLKKTRARLAREPRGWGSGAKEARQGCPGAPSSISFQAGLPPTLPADPGARSEPVLSPSNPKTQTAHP